MHSIFLKGISQDHINSGASGAKGKRRRQKANRFVVWGGLHLHHEAITEVEIDTEIGWVAPLPFPKQGYRFLDRPGVP